MFDRKMVIKWFEICRVDDSCSTECPYWGNSIYAHECTHKLASDVLTLLEEDEIFISRMKDLNKDLESIIAKLEKMEGGDFKHE